jgi:hypothetical protein
LNKILESKVKGMSKFIEKWMDKFTKRWYIILPTLYLFLVLWVIHYLHMKRENPTGSGVEWISSGFFDIFLNPFGIFPLPRGWFGITVLITFAFAFFTILNMIIRYLQRHYDPDTVQGDAKWLTDLDDYNKKFTEPFGSTDNSGKNNMIFSQDLFMSMNNSAIRRNMNVFIIGGSGSGKSFNFVGPNLLQANCSYAITDPSGGLYEEYGSFLEYYGYKIKCFNISHMEKSSHYNPFNYIHSDKDIEILVTTLISNTNPPDKQGGDPFWEKSETALLNALIAYLHHYTEPHQQNFSNVMRLMLAADIDENDSSSKSPLDYIFDEIAQSDPESFAAKQYGLFKMGAGKTLKGILISCGVRLQAFSLSDVALLTDTDDIALDRIGDEKTGLFIILPTGDKTFNFLASLMYSQLFQRVYDYCENTAAFSQLIIDGDGQLVKTFRADSEEDSIQKAAEAQEFFQRACEGRIVYNKQFDWWELRTQADELVFYRGTEELALRALYLLRQGGVKANSTQSNRGRRLPIHLRLLLDEFANIGKIPEFEQKVATIRKYEISVSIILQSLSQMKNLYKDNWSEISGNCDCTIYLGGGADTETTKWISELLGKETRAVVNTSFGKSGSMSVNRQGVELFASYQLRTMEEDDCIVLLKSMYAYKGKKYKTTNHPEHPLLESLNGYYFNPEKIEYLRRNDANYDDEYLPTPEEEHGDIEDPTKEEQDAQREYEEEKVDRAEELQEGKDADGNDIIEPASEIEKNPEKLQEKITSKNADAIENPDADDDLDSVTGVAVEVWGEEANQFSSTSADNADEGFYSEQ